MTTDFKIDPLYSPAQEFRKKWIFDDGIKTIQYRGAIDEAFEVLYTLAGKLQSIDQIKPVIIETPFGKFMFDPTFKFTNLKI